jgi:UDP-glucose 4-epimerase
MSKTKLRCILVTGGAGFIGTHTVNRLIALGHRVVVIDDLSTGRRESVNPAAELIVGSVTDEYLVQDVIGRVDGCIHLAAIASVERCQNDPHGSHRVNQSAFVSLLSASGRRPAGSIPVVYASSAAVYGAVALAPVAEDASTHPISTYGADKLGCELHARAAGVTAAIPSFGLRFFNVYGPGQNRDSPYSGVISIFADRLRRGETLTIHGDGGQSRDFVHVDDVVAAVIDALDQASPGAPICNIGTGIETSILGLASMLARLLGRPAEFASAPAREGDIRRSLADISRAREILGYSPQIGLCEGLSDLLKASV